MEQIGVLFCFFHTGHKSEIKLTIPAKSAEPKARPHHIMMTQLSALHASMQVCSPCFSAFHEGTRKGYELPEHSPSACYYLLQMADLI